MTNLTVALIVGSLRAGSFNRKLANGLILLAPSELMFSFVEVGDLPPYNQDDDDHPHADVVAFKDKITAAHAVMFVTPEYNRSIPGVLKNALDHASRPYGKSVWAKKPAGVIGVSIGATGTSMAQQHLRNILAYLDMPTLNQPEAFIKVADEMFAEDGSIVGPSRPFLQSWMDAFAAFAKTHAA